VFVHAGPRAMGFMELIDQMPWLLLIPVGIALGLAPFAPEPHLVEKLRMLSQGTLHKPIDIFDLIMHATPVVLIVVKGLHEMRVV
jgi:hypothetical protein